MTISQTQFGRSVRLRVGLPGAEGIDITGLRIKFKITKDDTPNPNIGDIEVYNLNVSTTALLQTPGAFVQLFVGYSDSENLMFVGDITRAVTTYEGASALTKITCGDSANTLSTAKVSASIKGKTTAGGALKAVLKGVVENPSSILSALNPDDVNKELPAGFSASGPLKQVLRGLARTRLFDWTYTDGKLVILSPGSATKEPAVNINELTGLIGSPARKKIGDGTKENAVNGIGIKILCNATVRPRRLIRLESREFTGWYLTRKVEHTGDTYGQEFFTIIDATEIKV